MIGRKEGENEWEGEGGKVNRRKELKEDSRGNGRRKQWRKEKKKEGRKEGRQERRKERKDSCRKEWMDGERGKEKISKEHTEKYSMPGRQEMWHLANNEHACSKKRI